jgi:inner membrane transporter RhtA
MLSVQLGAALSIGLFDRFGPTGTAWLRITLAAVILLAVARPRLRGHTVAQVATTALLGLGSGLMTVAFCEAVDRIPLGTAAALEFLGPLAVAAASLRRRIDVVWPLAALAGIVALTRPWSSAVDMTGVLLALAAGVGWAAYILLTQRVGDSFPGIQGLALSMTFAALFTAPMAGVPDVVGELDRRTLLIAVGTALLLPVIPYICEMLALRSMDTGAFGTLMSVEPAIGTGVGLVVLGQVPGPVQALGVALVCAAGVGAARRGARKDRDITGIVTKDP